MTRTAVVLLNLGAPDRPEAVAPFLRNMFGDRAILDLPQPARWLLGRYIAGRRAPIARAIYARIGGGSPLLENSRRQAAALEAALVREGEDFRVFVAMRYWHPRSAEVAAEVKAYGADRVLLLPLYPQFSGTTTASSFADWETAARRAGLAAAPAKVCCYPTMGGWIDALARLVHDGCARASESGRPRILFSAHGLPQRVIAAGDPYQWQVERTAAAVAAALGGDDLDWLVCYQSRVGRLPWIGPTTEAEIERAGRDGVAVVLVPISFVSEHSETLVELDIEYRGLAERAGVAAFVRVPTVGVDGPFIAGLAALAREALSSGEAVRAAGGGRICPRHFGVCARTGTGS